MSFTENNNILRSERSYVGAIINGDARLEDCLLTAKDFQDSYCRAVFTACRALHEAGEKPDYVTLSYKHAELDLVALDALVREAALDASLVRQHANNIRDAADRRSCTAMLSRAAALAADTAYPLEATLAKTRSLLDQTCAKMSSDTTVSGSDSLLRFNTRLFDEPPEPGISTGLPALDACMGGGLSGGRLYVIGARPAVGKSALLSFITENALEQGRRVLYISLEMGDQEVIQRMVAQASAVDCAVLTSRNLTEEQIFRVTESYGLLRPDNLCIATQTATLGAIRREALRMRAEGGLDLICVDYLQLMLAETGKNASRAEVVGEISRGLKQLAMELGCPVLAASQVNRASTYGEERAPRLSELRESGSIEQDADVVWLLHSPPATNKKGGPRAVTLQVAKNRQGSLAQLALAFTGGAMRFAEVKPGN